MINYETIRDMETEYHKVYPDSILLVLSGNFYNVYGKDTYILCYIFKFKLINKLYKTINNENVYIPKTGFPSNSLDRVLLELEERKINYVIKVKNKNDIFKDFKKLNIYKRKYEAGEKYCMDKIKVNEILHKCDDLCGKKDFSDLLDKIKKEIEEYRKNK